MEEVLSIVLFLNTYLDNFKVNSKKISQVLIVSDAPLFNVME